ncbi:hypothetical protein GM415_09205 [Pseudodesulfovibrio cashew]|uniref:Uncharacterized protein n=1 Tax=Pseudodesulfovibrio cashew TaxID=2678688 RepID=A0A6I6JRQ7_9BACT|nr:hypothetical protein [Pseudodesulfovibrio cashew]QGY40294.1 hypothetical protein GM415_09205 [Pseudodesulfovibrio cashew]
MTAILLSVCFVLFLIGCPAVAEAYIGPGAGLSAIGSFLALVAAVVAAIFGFLWYPIKRMMRRRKQDQQDGNGE